MTILSGATIRGLTGIIRPYHRRTKSSLLGVQTTYGESYAGYDLRLDRVDTPRMGIVDGVRYWIIEPGEFLLASAMEKFNMPCDVVAIVHDKSTWARRGLTVQNTVIEPGWFGYLTLELVNHSTRPLMLPQGCGICQVLFHRTDKPTEGYDGKYQDQSRGPCEAR